MDASLHAELLAASKIPQCENKVAFQVVPVQLRAWIVDQDDVVCRPYYLAVLELYPRGKVLSSRISSPASVKPTTHDLLAFLLAFMLDPPDGEPRQRPSHVSFVNEAEVDICGGLLQKIGVVCGQLSLADGVREYVSTFSERLVKMKRASRGDSAEAPGLLSVAGVGEGDAKKFMEKACGMWAAKPWEGIGEGLAIEVEVPGLGGRRLRYYLSVLGGGGKIVGFAVMASLEALRGKWRRSKEGVAGLSLDEEEDEEEGTTTAAATAEVTLGELLCAQCGSRVGEGVEGDGCRYVHRCGACKRLLYCDEQCQKLDWGRRHRGECEAARADKEYVFRRDEWIWLRRELALLFVDPTSVPFDDLDAGEEHGWKYIEHTKPPLYPIAFVTIEGPGGLPSSRKIDRPTAEELNTMTLLAVALTECRAPPPAGGEIMLPNGVSLKVAADLSKKL